MKKQLKEKSYLVYSRYLMLIADRNFLKFSPEAHKILYKAPRVLLAQGKLKKIRLSATEIRKIHDTLLAYLAEKPESAENVIEALRNVRSGVDVASRKVVLGIDPQDIKPTRNVSSKDTVRVYIHTLDGKPAVFTGRNLEYAHLGSSRHHKMPTSLKELRSQQREALRPYLTLPLAEYDSQAARMSWASFIVEPSPVNQSPKE